MIYRCNNCDAVFFEPETKHYKENLDGERGWWEYDYTVCPNCGSEEIALEDDENA